MAFLIEITSAKESNVSSVHFLTPVSRKSGQSVNENKENVTAGELKKVRILNLDIAINSTYLEAVTLELVSVE